ncbi:polysaccharide biosynthesis/export family protein [Desulfococcaceae bacterium HSG7]|nr:polysaccharide biosynthesis/export family protein [Desulfococcaceae bacterium HSG7]
MPRCLSFVLLIFLFVSLWGCGGSQKKLDEQHSDLVQSYSGTARDRGHEISEMNKQLLANANTNVDPSDYLLGSGDLLQVEVFGVKELEAKVRVSSRGYITLPLLNQVQVKGLSAREAEVKIEKLYKVKYIKNPHVSVFVKEHFSQRITVVGQVRNPGTYDYPTKLKLLDVLAIAGGLADKAGRSVHVRRIGGTHSGGKSFLVDLDMLIKKGKTELNIEISGSDVIFVPEAGVFFADGAVRKPGIYNIKRDMILQEAILIAGGLAPYADKDVLTLIRQHEDGQREVIELDFKKNVDSKQLQIQDRDVIIAKDSAWGKLTSGTGLNIGIPGIIGFGYRDPER